MASETITSQGQVTIPKETPIHPAFIYAIP
jgi:hypothetical protein